MARGRPLVAIYTSHRRSASLPADESRLSRGVSFELGADAQKANIIASQAARDSEDFVAASRRHDRDFLHDVANKLANINTVNVESVPRQNDASLIVHSRPPRSPRSPPVRSQPPPLVRRSVLSPDENLEITSYLQRQPSTTTTTTRTRRAVSVPPPGAALLPRPSVPRWFPTSGAYYGHRRYGFAAPVPVGLPPATTTTTRLPSDAVVGVAHTSQYGDIVIGIPYKKRFMFNAQHDSDALETQSLPPVHLVNVPTRVSSAPAYYHSAASHARNLALPYSRASYAGPFNVGGDVGAARHHVTTSGGNVDDVISIKSSASAAAAARTPKRSTKTLDIEADIASSIFGDEISAPVRPPTVSKDYQAVLSRYMPSNGPKSLTTLSENELDRKYGQILTSMKPRMSPRPSVSSSTTHTREYSSLPPAGPPKPKKAPVSGARKKLRELLCRSKGNPRYFDDAD